MILAKIQTVLKLEESSISAKHESCFDTRHVTTAFGLMPVSVILLAVRAKAAIDGVTGPLSLRDHSGLRRAVALIPQTLSLQWRQPKSAPGALSIVMLPTHSAPDNIVVRQLSPFP